jgi:NAD(P)-dependent dehydrogenase (short-subunit alcohol dehydrogenase family)
VTGARRGIGRETAVALARAGLRVAVTSSRPGEPVTRAVGGTARGLDATVDAIRKAGGEALALELDLLDRAGIARVVAEVADTWGRIDVLVNNAIYQGDGSQTAIAETDFEALERVFQGSVVNTLFLTCEVLRRAGSTPVTVVNVGSASGKRSPSLPFGSGGVALSYAASKAALHRIAPLLQDEYGRHRVRAFTVNPGFVRTEALLETVGDIPGAARPEMPAEVIRWLATSPDADDLLGQYLDAAPLYDRIGPELAEHPSGLTAP